ncbi:hypothetical protein MHBO_003193 [Bonamia ostreae]|uniref:Uncharacterized protein n=2 Tax=Bonamia ostreae TaxID=126728 RepID=A0ABV2APT2_9EUKA
MAAEESITTKLNIERNSISTEKLLEYSPNIKKDQIFIIAGELGPNEKASEAIKKTKFFNSENPFNTFELETNSFLNGKDKMTLRCFVTNSDLVDEAKNGFHKFCKERNWIKLNL